MTNFYIIKQYMLHKSNAKLTYILQKKNYKPMWHNIIKYEINLNFEKFNHIMSLNL